MKKIIQIATSLGPVACVAIVLGATSFGWLSFRLLGWGKGSTPTGGASAEIVEVIKKLTFKPLYVFDQGVLIARPPAKYLSGATDKASPEEVENWLRDQATLELEYRATSSFSVDFKDIDSLAYSEMSGRSVLSMTLPQPKMVLVDWTNEADTKKWDVKDGRDKKWLEFLNKTHNRELFVEAAVRRHFDNEEYRSRAREKTEKFVRSIFAVCVDDPQKDIVVNWQTQ